ncbi:coiled-coil domain-containing protein 43-like [Salvelinus namaycush]|uniref:Coiled-coil domain-containing protein 43 n=1 Tax=Salvelinus namaycush TaxID=8040 RepID=A0A8U0U2N3_SALNM|nr:coiled-coil domain-containing protein 43-like [Salvelinus namaycush]
MAASMADAGEFEKWLNDRLDSLEVDQEVYGAYILGILKEEESDEEKEDALLGILSAFLEDEKLEDVCKEIISQWAESCARSATKNKEDAEVLAIANLIEKQAQIVVKQKEVSQESRKRKEAKEAVLAQYANITDDEDEAEEEEQAFPPSGDKSLFKNTNVEEVLSRKKQQRDQAKEDSHKKKETDKMQREKDKLARQDRKDKEKKRTQKGERKR